MKCTIRRRSRVSTRAMRRETRAREEYDLFPKLADDFARRTATGGAISSVGLVVVLALLSHQCADYAFGTTTTYDLAVDDDGGGRGQRMRINVDVTLRAMHCAQVSLDAMDVTGESRLDVSTHEVRKTRVDARGVVIEESATKVKLNADEAKSEGEKEKESEAVVTCGDCYGAGEEGQCCDDCGAVREAYRIKGWSLPDLKRVAQCVEEIDASEMMNANGEGCRFTGHFDVNKVAGNFHLAPGKSFDSNGRHVHDLAPFQGLETFNFSHVIHKVSFGEDFPGVVNPLDGVSRAQETSAGTYQYRLSVVPARYKYHGLNARVVESNDYSVTDHFTGFELSQKNALPGIFFFYDLSPLRVEYEEKRMGFFQFLSNVAAVIGGVSAMTSIIDGLVYRGQQALKEKIDLGKQG